MLGLGVQVASFSCMRRASGFVSLVDVRTGGGGGGQC